MYNIGDGVYLPPATHHFPGKTRSPKKTKKETTVREGGGGGAHTTGSGSPYCERREGGRERGEAWLEAASDKRSIASAAV